MGKSKKRNRSSSSGSDSNHYLKNKIKKLEERLDQALSTGSRHFASQKPKSRSKHSSRARTRYSSRESSVRSPRDSTNRRSRGRSSRSSTRESIHVSTRTTASSSHHSSLRDGRERSPRGSSQDISEYSEWEQNTIEGQEGDNINDLEPPTPEDNAGDILILENDETLDVETLKYLGENPELQSKTFNVHKTIAERWTQILKNGLDKEMREELIKKHQIPDNLKVLKAPAINAEVIPILPPLTLKKDGYQEKEQNQLGVGLAILSAALDLTLKENNRSPILPLLWESAKTLTDLHYQLSMARRAHITPLLNKSAKEVAATTFVDSTLFGTAFGERCKEAKGMEKASKDLVPAQQKQPSFKKPRNTSLNRRGPSRPMREAGRYGPPPQRKRYTKPIASRHRR